MEKILLFLVFSLLGFNALAQDVRVSGYVRSNGTYVAPHYRTRPDNTQVNNFSTVGNINPYTGRAGYIYPNYNTTSSVNLPLVQKVLSTKQNSYNSNADRIYSTIDKMRDILLNSDLDADMISRIRSKFNSRYLEPMYAKNYDFSDTAFTTQIINWLYDGITNIIKEEEALYINSYVQNGTYFTLKRRAVLWDVPYMGIATSLGEVPNLRVLILEKPNDAFYKVQSGNKIGYITSINFK